MKILLITHDTSFSGAPKSLLLVWEEIKKTNKIDIDVLALRETGGFYKRFFNLARHFIDLSNFSKSVIYTFLSRVKYKLFKTPIISSYEMKLFELASINYDYVYANTIVSFEVAHQLKKINPLLKIIGHIHELSTVINEFCPNINKYDAFIDTYVVPSFLNKSCLINEYAISAKKIVVIREAAQLEFSKEKLHLNDSAKLRVIMCGGAYWRKGDDLFMLLANQICNLYSDIHFYWVGNMSIERERVNRYDIKKMGIADNVHFIAETEFPNDFLPEMDIFLLTSREDPFPLSAIEAGLYGLPIICFANATGIAEFLSNDEMIVPYLDLKKMEETIIKLYFDTNLKKDIGLENKYKFSDCLPEKIASETVKLLKVYE